MPAPSAASSTAPVSQSGIVAVDALVAGTRWGESAVSGANLTYSFPWTTSASAVFSGHSGTGDYSLLNEYTAATHYGLSATQQAAVRGAMQAWANLANIKFIEVADTAANVGDIRIAWTSISDSTPLGTPAWGWSKYPDGYFPSGGDIWISTKASGTGDQDWSAGSGNFQSLVHELGHALGLKHSFEGSPVLPAVTDSQQYSVMSYAAHPHSLFVSVSKNLDGSVTAKSFNVYPDTPMLYDIAAIQYIYGPNTAYAAGNDTYTFDPAKPFIRTLWDTGGTDTISVANFAKGCTIDLVAGHFSKITIESDSTAGFNWSSQPPSPTYDGTDNLAIAYDCTIENAIGGGGPDILLGNDAANVLTGGGGNDQLSGGNGRDTAIYSLSKRSYVIGRTANGWSVKATTGAEGMDSLTGIERLKFADMNVALDLDGSAGLVAKLLGAVFGPASVANRAAVAIGLERLDGGTSYLALANFALEAAGLTTPEQIVSRLWTNIVGVPPSSIQAQPYVDMLRTGTAAELVVFAAELPENVVRINLVGLQNEGLPYAG